MSDMKDIPRPQKEKQTISIQGLRELAIYFEGKKDGRGGSLEPFGTMALDNLWNTIKYLNGKEDFNIK